MIRRLRQLALMAAAAALFSAAGAAAPATAADTPVKGGDLSIAIAGSVSTIDPQATTSFYTRLIAAPIFEAVLTTGEKGAVIPQLAKSYEQADDAKSYTFHLRSGVKFQNGKTMTVDDVIASWERMKKTGADQGVMKFVDKFERVDDLTVRAVMAEADPTFIDRLASPRVLVGIMPAEEAAKPVKEFTPIGTGPFRFVEWVPDSHIKLGRFDDYSADTSFDGPDGFGGKRTAYVDTVTFRFVPEAGARTAGILTGDFGVAEQIPSTDVPRIDGDPVADAVPFLPVGKVHVTFNVTRDPVKNLKFRQAVQMALDADTALNFATGGNYQLGPGLLYPGNPAYTDAGTEHYNVHDLDAARKLLAESGYSGQPVTLLTTGDQAIFRDFTVALADQLGKIGINTTISAVDSATWVAMLKEKDKWDITVNAFGLAPFLGPLGMLFHFSGPANLQGYQDPAVEDAANRARTALTEEERIAGFADYQRTVFENVYSIIVGAYGQYIGVNKRVHNFSIFRVHRPWDVWVDPKG